MGSGRVIVREVPYGKRYRSIVRGFFWEVTRRRRELGAGSTRRAVPAFMRRQWRRGGPARIYAAPRQYGGRGGFYGKWPRYSAGGFLWEATLYQEKFARQNSGF